MSLFKLSATSRVSDVDRIVNRLSKLHEGLVDSDGIVFKFIMTKVMDGYVKSVTSAMGVVPAEGGSVTPEAFLGLSATLKWESLAPNTIAKKKKNKKNGWHTEIWAATGLAKDSVKVHEYHTRNTHKMFAGLQKSDGAAYMHAWRAETGQGTSGKHTPRALFSVITNMFKYQTPIIVSKVQKMIIASSEWGK